MKLVIKLILLFLICSLPAINFIGGLILTFKVCVWWSFALALLPFTLFSMIYLLEKLFGEKETLL